MSAIAVAPATTNSDAEYVTLRAYAKETYYQLIKFLREPGFGLPIVGFPVIFFLLFGLLNRGNTEHGFPASKYLLASYTCFGSMGAAFFGVGVGLSYERGHGWLELKRLSPMPTGAYLFSKMVASIAFGQIILITLIAIGAVMAPTQITFPEALHLGLVLSGGVVAFSSLGVFLGLVCAPGSAASVANMVYLPLSLLGGMWMPLEVFPAWLQKAAHFLPSYYFSRLGLHALGFFDESELAGWLTLAAYAAVFSFASALLFRRQEAAH